MGVTLAALLETVIPNHIPGVLWFPGVAVIEETIKIAIVWWLARSLKAYYLRDGMVLGACGALASPPSRRPGTRSTH